MEEQEKSTSTQSEEIQNQAPTQEGQSSGTKIMIVEDDRFFIDLLAKRLTDSGFTVIPAHDGEEALNKLKEDKPRVVLLDILLPEMDGFEVLSKIKANDNLKDMPVIMLSNLGSKEDLQKAKELGAHKFMIKATVSLDQIINEVKLVLEGQ